MMQELNLYQYQNRAVNFVTSKRKVALFLDMGMGKTLITLKSISDMLADLTALNVLIIAPLRVANTTWSNEIDKWIDFKHLTYQVCTQSLDIRTDNLNKKVNIHIINRENVPWLVENIVWKWDTVVIDESSSFKSHKSKRFRALKAVIDKIENIILLTGTPSPQSYMDIWSQLYLVDKGERLGKTITQYRTNYFKMRPYAIDKWDIVAGADKIIKEKINDVCISMNQKDYLELPDMVYSEVIVPMDNATKKIYADFSKNYIMTHEGVDITANQKASLQNKLLQICNGAIYDNDKNTIVLNDDKVQALRDMIDDNPNENFLVAYTYKSDLERLQKEFKGIVRVLDTSSDTIKQWNDGKIKMLLAHPASAGHGLNLQHGGNTIVWFGLTWSLELYQQFNKRLHRLGQKNTVKIIHLISDTVEEMHVAKALQYKAKNQEEFLAYIQANTILKFNNTRTTQ